MVACNEDFEAARSIARPLTAVHARFSVMHNRIYGPLPDAVREGLQTVHDSYDMNLHAQAGAHQSSTIPESVVDAYAVAGPPSYCAERILEWISLGYRRISISNNSPDTDADLVLESQRLIADRVLPEVRASLPSS